MRIRVAVDSQAFAQISKAYVVSACGVVDDDMIRKLELSPDQEKIVRDPTYCGGSVIVAPNLRVIAGPLGAEEGILYADCDLEMCIAMKLRHDLQATTIGRTSSSSTSIARHRSTPCTTSNRALFRVHKYGS
jgi:aliphatic nitrilase